MLIEKTTAYLQQEFSERCMQFLLCLPIYELANQVYMLQLFAANKHTYENACIRGHLNICDFVRTL